MTYNEICTILSFVKNFQVVNPMNIQNFKLNLTYYSIFFLNIMKLLSPHLMT
jgi:hypothetical protein